MIICGDNVETLATFDADCIDLTVTSPPYGELRAYGGHSWDFEGLAQQLWRVTKPGGVVVWVVADQTIDGSESGDSFRQALRFKEIGFRLHDTMIYKKQCFIPLTHNRYEQCWEYMFVFANGRPSVWNPIMVKCDTFGTKQLRAAAKQYEPGFAMRRRFERVEVNEQRQHENLFVYSVGKNDKTAHNAPFPEALARDHIISWSNPGDLVYDPFMGSGTTGKMARVSGRDYVGSETSREYCDIAEKRVSIYEIMEV